MSTAARRERDLFCDTLAEVGPDAPTLCEGWATRDLAAHIVVRERRPDAAPGVVISALAGRTERVQRSIADGPWDDLIDTVRSGPPKWSPMRFDPLDRAANSIEFFVHHEDVRRATEPWEPREIDGELARDMHGALGRMARLLVRKAPVGVVLEPTDGHEPIRARKGDPVVTLRGPVGELVLFVYGRQDQARVELDGEPAAVDALRSTPLGL